MRKYEMVTVVKMDTPEATLSSLSKKIEKILNTKPGKLLQKDDWGIKKLAYEIKKQREGRYFCWTFEQGPEVLPELERRLKYDESVLRFLIVVASKLVPKEKISKPKTEKPAEETPGEEKPNLLRRRPPSGKGERLERVDYKDILALSRFVTGRGKIMPRRFSGIDATSQRAVAQAIKRARHLALLAYTKGAMIPEESRGVET